MRKKPESESEMLNKNCETAAMELPIEAEVFHVEGHVGFTTRVDQGSGYTKTPWVWYAPTLDGLPGPEEQWMFQKFKQAGISVAGIDVRESFGSPDGRALFTEFYQTVTEERGYRSKTCLLARSRGGLMLYNWAVEHPDCVSGIAGIYPVCNLMSYPGPDKACPAYGLTESELIDAIQDHNPIDRLEPLARSGVPIFHIHGNCDEVVPIEENSASLAERYRGLGGEITLRVVEGQGHNMWTGWFQCDELVQFVVNRAIVGNQGEKIL